LRPAALAPVHARVVGEERLQSDPKLLHHSPESEEQLESKAFEQKFFATKFSFHDFSCGLHHTRSREDELLKRKNSLQSAIKKFSAKNLFARVCMVRTLC
jgi:hypothetical protein